MVKSMIRGSEVNRLDDALKTENGNYLREMSDLEGLVISLKKHYLQNSD